MNVILLIVAIVLACLAVQAEINHERSMRMLNTVLLNATIIRAEVATVQTTVNEMQRDLLDEPSMGHHLVIKPVDDGRIAFLGGEVTNGLSSFDRHTESALHLVRGEN